MIKNYIIILNILYSDKLCLIIICNKVQNGKNKLINK